MGLDLLDQLPRLEIGDDAFARREAVEAPVARRCFVVDARVGRKDVDLLESVALACLVVVEVVGGGDLHAAASEGGIHQLIGNDRDAAMDERQIDFPADECPIAFVRGMDRDGGVAEHRLRPGGGDAETRASVGERIADMPEEAVFLFRYHFQIGDGGAQHRVPVHQAASTIDESLVVELHEGLDHRRGKALVHGEALVGPVHGCAHPPELLADRPAGHRLPLPHPLDECFSTDVLAGEAFGVELTFDHHLGGDAGMVAAGLPQGVARPHPLVAGEGIHDGVLEGMPHVQGPGDVGRRDHDAVGRTAPGGGEVLFLLPGPVPLLLDQGGIVGLVHDVVGYPELVREARWRIGRACR